MADSEKITKKTPPEVIEKDIARTRNEMSNTIDEIEERLSAEHWKAIVKDKMREKKDIAMARGRELADKARNSARQFGRAAGEKSSTARDRALRFMKNNQLAASAMAFELGAWLVIGIQSVIKRGRQAAREREAGGSEYARAKIMSIEEVEQKVQKAALSPEEKYKKAA